MNDDAVLEPQSLYNSVKDIHKQNTESFFNDLVKESGINIEENRQTNNKIAEKNKELESQKNSLNSKTALKSFLIALGVILIIAAAIALVAVFLYVQDHYALIISISAVALALGIFTIVITNKKINPLIKELESKIANLDKEKDDLIREAKSQMAPLNDLFDWNIAPSLFSKTIPLIKLDPYFDNKKFELLHEKYGFKGHPEKNVSTLFVQSGSILGNPFLIEKNFTQWMGTKKYTGSLVIHWTTTSRDSEGHYHTHHHSQTLHASVEKPKPFYGSTTQLVYGNDAAGKLCFSRVPTKLTFKNEKDYNKYIENFDEELDKKTKESIKNNGDFQRLHNTEFEAIFHALDRNDNIEFRLLFTPLAQKNLISLLRSSEPFGDDFSFIKSKNLNFIKSDHSQNFNYNMKPESFQSYNIDECQRFFTEYNEKYFENLYYDLAPILSIPMYQRNKAFSYIYKDAQEYNFTDMETESMANSYDDRYFRNEQSATPCILKRQVISKGKESDLNEIQAYSFKIIKRVDYVDTFGGDGHMHAVPVEWDEYIPINKATRFTVQKCNTTKPKYDNCYRNGILNDFLSQYVNKDAMIFQRGFVSFLNNDSSYVEKDLNNIFTDKKEN